MVLFGDLEAGESYLYHYTNASTLAVILDGGTLRLGPYSRTRDPRENKEWSSSFSADPDEDTDPANWDMFDVSRRLDAIIRQRAKMACLTLDRPAHSPASAQAARGYGRARMWEQYADQHRGAVLIFDQRRLEAAVREHLGGCTLLLGAVRYTDEGLEFVHGMHFRVADTKDRDRLAEVADAVIREHGDALFFGKNTDWLTESEYRYVVVNDRAEEFVPITDSLVGIVLGEAFPSHEASVLGVRLERLGVPDLSVARCWWRNGQPIAVPLDL